MIYGLLIDLKEFFYMNLNLLRIIHAKNIFTVGSKVNGP